MPKHDLPYGVLQNQEPDSSPFVPPAVGLSSSKLTSNHARAQPIDYKASCLEIIRRTSGTATFEAFRNGDTLRQHATSLAGAFKNLLGSYPCGLVA